MYKILVIEDDILELDRMSDILSLEGFNSIKASTGNEGLRKIKEESPDLITIDIGLPDMDGRDILAQIRQTFMNPIIMITANKTIDDVVEAMNLGANDYIAKPFGIDVFLKKINKNLKSPKDDLNKSYFRTGELRIDFTTRSLILKGVKLNLTPNEYNIIRFLANNAGKVMPYEQIITAVWGERFVYTHENLKPHIINLRHKIEEDPTNPKYILTHRSYGYSLQIF